MKRKVVSVILCGTMVLGMVTGCGSSKGGDSGDKVTINLYQNKSEISSQLQEAADKYTEENPNVTINVESIQGNDYNTNLKAKLISDDSGKLKDKYPQLEAVEEYAAKETWIPGLHTLNAPLACEYSSATELRNSDQLGLKYADSLKALLDLETKYTTSKDDLSKLNAVDYSSEIGGGLAIERVAVVQQGNWIGPELSGIDEEVANKMGILPIPLKGVKEDCIPTGISIYWCINSQSGDKEKEASKEFLKWLFQSDEGKQIVVNDFGFVPAFNNYDDVEITDTLSKEVKRYIDEGKTLPWVMGGFPSGYEPKAAADFQGYFSGEYTFDQMVDQLKADFVELKK